MFKKIALLAGAGALVLGAAAPAFALVGDPALDPHVNDVPQTFENCKTWFLDEADTLTLTLPTVEKNVEDTVKDELDAQTKFEAAKERLQELKDTAKKKNRVLTPAEKSEKALLEASDTTPKSKAYYKAAYDLLLGTGAKAQQKLSTLYTNIKTWNIKYNNCLVTLAENARYKNCDQVDAAFEIYNGLVKKYGVKSANAAAMSAEYYAKAKTSKYDDGKSAWNQLGKMEKELSATYATMQKDAKNVVLNKINPAAKELSCPGYPISYGAAAPAEKKAADKKAADKKAADNKVNNAAAKEGNGLAATGSVASVAGLLSALAVLAGGAFVGIRRFNS